MYINMYMNKNVHKHVIINHVERVLRRFPSLCGFHARVVLLDSDAFRPGLLGEVDDGLGVLGRSCCPDCSACSGVVVEGRVNEEGDVLVVNGR